ncbi:MAG: UvrD-helicase domain-containing protein [Ilumatobacteraceae bacterium]|nr:UvrD-helicase domain-containing protein [Ilumatobacteraceae bacterium]
MDASVGTIVLPPWVQFDPDRSMAVSAGAGSGKTTSLVARVASLLRMPGVQPSQLVVITFTEKAAREVSHRLREAVGSSVTLDEAFIGTIHGFCQSLLRRHPIEAELPPKFTTADELTSGAMADERAEQAVQTLYNLALKKPAIAEALMVIASFGAMQFLPELVRAIDNDWLRFADSTPERPMSIGVAHSTVMHMLDGVTSDQRYLTASKGMRSKLDEALIDARSTLEFVESVPALSAAAAAIGERRHGSSAAWAPFADALHFASCEPALSQLMSALTPIVIDSARTRISRGELSFDDLLVLTRRLLQTQPAVRDEVRARHRYLFVDEFQDTDQVQFDVITELTAADSARPPSSLFAVGDPKQSIYGFRHADVELFSSLLAADTAGEQLTINRRTRADVCLWINAVLGQRFARVDDAGEADQQVAYTSLEPQRLPNASGDGPGVVVLGMPGWCKVEHDSAEDMARAEAADIAALVQRIVGGGDAWMVSDNSGDRPASYRDVTVLIRSRTRLGVLEHALRQTGIPYRVEGGTLIYGSREVYELLRVLRAIDDPTNQLKVVTALRTSIFGIDDRQLMHHRLGPDTAPARYPKDFRVFAKEAGVVGDALRTLDQFGRRKHERTPAELLAELYDTWRGVAAALCEGEQVARETWRRVRYVIDEARAWSDATGGTLAEYLAWVDRRIDDVDRVELSTDEGEDSLRIMTIHAAKGLEFPITIVAGLGGADATNSATGLHWQNGRPLVRLGKMTSAGLRDMTAVERQRDRAEEARLLYVAFTRAKDHLVVSMHHKYGNCAAGRLVDAVASESAIAIAEFADPQLPIAHPPSHTRPTPGQSPVDEPEELDRTIGQVRRIWTPSGLAKALGDAAGPTSDVSLVQGSLFAVDDDDADDDAIAPGERFGAAVGRRQPDSDDHEATDPGNRKEPGPNDRPSRRGGRFGTAKGSAVHAVMQQVALDDPMRGLPTLVDVAAEAEGVLDRRRDIETMVQSLLKGELFSRMQTSSNCRREMYVGAQFGEVTVWGYVDAVFVNPGGTLTLVDFKTDTLITSPTELALRYQPQMSAYVAALQQATGIRVSEAWLSVAQPDGAAAVEILVDVVEAAELLAAVQVAPV